MTIDTSVLDSYRDFMEEEAEDFIQEILGEFYKNSQELLKKLAEVPNEATLDDFVRAAHTLKSTSATVGATELSAQAALLEQKGKEQAFAEIATLLPALREVFDEAEAELKKLYA